MAMTPKEFSKYFNRYDWSLQQQIIYEILRLTMQKDGTHHPGESSGVKCPHCNSGTVIKNGKLSGMRRFACQSCHKYFSQSTGKFWYALKKRDHVHKYLFCLLSGYSIRKSATETGISIQTSFDWRHKFLESFSKVLPAGLQGIAESADPISYLEKSRNGQK